jgi:hypothetical protein
MLADEQFNFVVLMEDRQPDFFLTYDGYDSESYTRLNRHGPYDFSSYHATHADTRLLVNTLHDAGIKIMFGFWIHENRWVARRHPELLLTDAEGNQQTTTDFSSDFNPLLEFQRDDEYYGIKRGDRFVEFVCRQYDRISSDFGFDGLFLGDGGLGFRSFGNDNIGVNFYDYSKVSLRRFLKSGLCDDKAHQGSIECLLSEETISSIIDQDRKVREGYGLDSVTTSKISADIRTFHFDQFINFSCAEWAGFYNRLATHLHKERADLFGAYSCMNYDASTARLHGVDYSAIAAAGLDYLVFQTYDHAWRQHFGLANKDILSNLTNLVSVQDEIRSVTEAHTKVLFTAETADSIEGWQCPIDETLEQTRLYSCGGQIDFNTIEGRTKASPSRINTSRSADGFFLVWINETPRENIGRIRREFDAAKNRS